IPAPPPAEATTSAAPPPVPGFEQPRVQRFQPPHAAFSGAPLDIAVDITGSVRGVVLHSRHAGEVRYESTPMRPSGDDFWVGTVEAPRVRAPGIDYFIEMVGADGVALPAVGDGENPLPIDVRDAPKP